MKFDCGETWQEKKERLENWHRWFAWYPVKIKDHDCRWLEVVVRKGKHRPPECVVDSGYWIWEYGVIL